MSRERTVETEQKRKEQGLLAGYLKEYEDYRFGKTDEGTYHTRNMQRAEQLIKLHPEEQCYQLMKAGMLIRSGKRDEGELILKKYEKNRVLQMKNPSFRGYFLYLAGMLAEDSVQKKNAVIQLQKMYQKDPLQSYLYWFLVRLDDGFERNPEKKLAFLEKQWKLGCHHNLLYVEVVSTLRKNPEAGNRMDNFIMQNYTWALRRRVISKEMGAQIARAAMRLKSCDAKYEYLLRKCYRVFSTKELLAALCSLYIRSSRTDEQAGQYYARGVEFELKLANLYEYYMMAQASGSGGLLPEQVLYYFLYHHTLSASQKVFLYKNLVCYGDRKSEIYEKYEEQIQTYVVESLMARRISPEYAYLYDRLLYPEIFSEELAAAMADMMFLRRIICRDKTIREVEVSYDQLSGSRRYLLKNQMAYIPVYVPNVRITLVDEQGNLYRNTISYELEKLLDEKRYLDICSRLVKNHRGMLLYLCEGRGKNHTITEKNRSYFSQILETEGFDPGYSISVMFELMEYACRRKKLEEIPREWMSNDGKLMNREQRGRFVWFLCELGFFKEAYQWIRDYGTVFISAHTILKILTALSESREAEEELYYRLCYGCFQNGQMNYSSLKYLSDAFLGTCRQMTDLWKQARAFGVDTYELEERILVQMMFTGTELPESFEIYLSYNQRGPRDYLKRAYLTYAAREYFVRNREQDVRYFFLLEEELQKDSSYADICKLVYLKYLSGKPQLSIRQKQLSSVYLKDFFAKKCYYGFMQKFGRTITEALVLEDKIFLEYHASGETKVVLHYVIEKDDQSPCSYQSCRMYPAYGGVYSKTFSLLEGEKITYFITEREADGTEHSTSPETVTKENQMLDSGTRYGRINTMRELKAAGNTEALRREAEEFYFLDYAAEQLFPLK